MTRRATITSRLRPKYNVPSAGGCNGGGGGGAAAASLGSHAPPRLSIRERRTRYISLSKSHEPGARVSEEIARARAFARLSLRCAPPPLSRPTCTPLRRGKSRSVYPFRRVASKKKMIRQFRSLCAVWRPPSNARRSSPLFPPFSHFDGDSLFVASARSFGTIVRQSDFRRVSMMRFFKGTLDVLVIALWVVVKSTRILYLWNSLLLISRVI